MTTSTTRVAPAVPARWAEAAGDGDRAARTDSVFSDLLALVSASAQPNRTGARPAVASPTARSTQPATGPTGGAADRASDRGDAPVAERDTARSARTSRTDRTPPSGRADREPVADDDASDRSSSDRTPAGPDRTGHRAQVTRADHARRGARPTDAGGGSAGVDDRTATDPAPDDVTQTSTEDDGAPVEASLDDRTGQVDAVVAQVVTGAAPVTGPPTAGTGTDDAGSGPVPVAPTAASDGVLPFAGPAVTDADGTAVAAGAGSATGGSGPAADGVGPAGAAAAPAVTTAGRTTDDESATAAGSVPATAAATTRPQGAGQTDDAERLAPGLGAELAGALRRGRPGAAQRGASGEPSTVAGGAGPRPELAGPVAPGAAVDVAAQSAAQAAARSVLTGSSGDATTTDPFSADAVGGSDDPSGSTTPTVTASVTGLPQPAAGPARPDVVAVSTAAQGAPRPVTTGTGAAIAATTATDAVGSTSGGQDVAARADGSQARTADGTTAGAFGAALAQARATDATATTAAPAPTATAGQQPVADQVTRHVLAARMLRDGTQHSVLHLSPEHLGAVRVTVDLRDGRVRLGLAGSEAAISALSADLPALRSQLADAGLDLADVSFDRQASTPDTTAGDGGRQGRDRAPDGAPTDRGTATDTGGFRGQDDRSPGSGPAPRTEAGPREPLSRNDSTDRPATTVRENAPDGTAERVDIRV